MCVGPFAPFNVVRCDTLTSRLPWSHVGLRANRRHHVFLPGSLIGLRSMARTGWKRDVSGVG